MDRMLQMIINRIIRRSIARGVDAGISAATRARGGSDAQARKTRQAVGQGRRLLRMARRMGRF